VLLGLAMPVRRGHVAPRTTIIETIIRKFDTHSELQIFSGVPQTRCHDNGTLAAILADKSVSLHFMLIYLFIYLFMTNLTTISVAEAIERQIMRLEMNNE
jgi:hypothetical protein